MDIKSRILTKAEELGRLIGFRAITMDDLAAQLGISKKTIYQFYNDKNELVDDVMSEVIKKSQEKCLFAASTSKNAIDEIFITMEMVREDLQNLNPIIVYDLQNISLRPI
ncbi:MAG: TetR/AcrR family transcriptional regulator [Saprospiraceae bacterium]|nr:TetR/AcrR family transcriptional regulator [Saprospiraceae bacterium]